MLASKLLPCLLGAAVVWGQTQVDLSRQVRNTLPYATGGTNAATQIDARINVGSAYRVATDFAGADIGEKINNTFASFGSLQCGTVLVPPGEHTYSSTIYVSSGCTLLGVGRSNGRKISLIAPDQYADTFGSRLVYNGPPATAAISLGGTQPTALGKAYSASIRNLAVASKATACPSNGMLKWNAAATGTNKWQCHDGTTYTAPTAHLAGIHHGSINPTLTDDGAHIVVENVDIGGVNYDTNLGQGAFHIGLWFNGCEECTVQSVYVRAADDGFSFGPNANGVLVNQITARENRRAGIHVRWFNDIVFQLPLMESNHWSGQPVTPGYGIGFLCDAEDIGGSAPCTATLRDVYNEGNWLDMSAPSASNPFGGYANGRGLAVNEGGALIGNLEGYFRNATIQGCVIGDGTKVHVGAGGYLNHDCTVLSGTIDNSGGGSVITTTKGPRSWKVEPASSNMAWEFNPPGAGGHTPMTFRHTPPAGQGSSGAFGVMLNANRDAAASESVVTPWLSLVGRGWKDRKSVV